MWHRRNRSFGAGDGRRLWPVFSILILGVVLPSAGVLWFMNEAMQNEHLAVRQRLADLYESQLRVAAGRMQSFWQESLSALEAAHRRSDDNPVAAFAALVQSGAVDSVLFYHAGGAPAYPDPVAATRLTSEPESPVWRQARLLEYEKDDAVAASLAYGRIAREGREAGESAQALVAQARCLHKARQQPAAIRILTGTLAAGRYRNAIGSQNRMVVPNALLFALSLMKEHSHPEFQRSAQLLAERLNDYQTPAMPASQRRFLMKQLQALWPECPPFPTMAAEDLAAAFAETHAAELIPGQLQLTSLPGIWGLQSSDKTMIALFRQDHLLAILTEELESLGSVPGIRFTLLPPGRPNSAYLATPLGEGFPLWQLALIPEGPDPWAALSGQRNSVYLRTGILMTASILMLSLVMATYLNRQMRLTQLKSDLIGTVSHELKTPLASMRLLVDTLAAGHYRDEQQVREYLQLIASENSRLSNLIENFLTFSRMERHKAAFDRTPLPAQEIVRAAVEAVGERLQAPDCRLELSVAPDLPFVTGDRDALVTVLINLLDNALKYSGADKWIRVHAFVSNGSVCIDVEDNGIGFSRTTARRIFERFYQADRSLSRQTGGCGLGLSIVKFIVAEHGGVVTARSQPGKGSTFSVRLPAATQ